MMDLTSTSLSENKLELEKKIKGAQLATAIDDERGGKVTRHTIAEFEMAKDDSYIEKFWSLLGGRVSSIKTAAEGGSDDLVQANKRMFKVSEDSGRITCTEVDFSRKSLSSSDCFIVDIGSEVYVWIGTGASALERKSALPFGQNYLVSHGRPAHTPLTRVMEGAEMEVLYSHLH